jgi:hypothetical protein
MVGWMHERAEEAWNDLVFKLLKQSSELKRICE